MTDEVGSDSNDVSADAEVSTPETQDDTESQETTEEEPDYSGQVFKIKVDGEEREVTYEEMVKSTQLDKASYKRMEEASKLAKQVQPILEIINAAKAGDTSVLKKLGIPKDALRKFSEEQLLALIEEEDRSPEEQKAHEAEERARRLEAENKEIKDREFRAYQRHLESEAATKIQNEIQDAFKELGIPLKGNSRLVARTCEDRLMHRDRGKETTMVESLKRSLKTLDDEFSEYARREFEKDPDSFLARLPENIPDGIRKRSLKEVKSQLPVGGFENEFNKKPRPGVSKKPDDDFKEYMRREMQGRRG
jgi:hypothetical protein